MKTKLLIKQALGTLFFFILLFVCAGRFLYWQGWVYVLIGLVMMVLSYTILKIDDDLMIERSKPQEGTKKWDKFLLLLSFFVTLGMVAVAGLDSGRFHWSPEFHRGAYALGILFTITGQLLFLVAQKQNKFFSSTVRIQTERGHVVCDTGLYKIVRHPAYLGSVIQLAGFPLLFGSLWSLVPAGVSVIITGIRTYLEDKTLQQELAGYPEYAGKTRYKLIPFIW